LPEALEIARDVARKLIWSGVSVPWLLIEARRERQGVVDLPTTQNQRDYTIVIAA
jgi:hypothetical protein